MHLSEEIPTTYWTEVGTQGECDNFPENLEFAGMAVLARLQHPQVPHGLQALVVRRFAPPTSHLLVI